jgi:hypothetical protein
MDAPENLSSLTGRPQRRSAHSTAFAMGVAGPEWTARLESYEAMTVLTGDVVVTTPGFRRLQSAAARAISSVG